jgi:tRNA U34 5-methylaminomethyl-2-thiouridine-forming methyltransferase MnmC
MNRNNFGDLVQTDDGSYTILDRSIDEEYHSTYGARSEADELYMVNSGFRDELNNSSSKVRSYQVLDVGMGLAYNAMMTLDVWSKALSDVNIKMCSLEINEELVSALSKNEAPWMKGWPENWIEWAKSLKMTDINTWQAQIRSKNHGGYFFWEVKIGDAADVNLEDYSFDYIWQDAFSQKKNPELWSDLWFQKLHKHSSEKAIIVTYSVARIVKDGLSNGGWEYEKCKGSGVKKQWMRATIKRT